MELKESVDVLKTQAAQEIEKNLNRLAEAISLLLAGSSKNFLTSIIGDVETVSQDQFLKTIQEFDFQKVLEEIEELAHLQQQNQEKQASTSARIAEIKPWVGLDWSLEALNFSEKISVWPVLIPKAGYKKFLAEVGKIKLAEFSEVAQKTSEVYGLIVFVRSQNDLIEKILVEASGAVVSLPAALPPAVLAGLEQELAALQEEAGVLRSRLKEYEKNLLSLKIFYDHLYQGKIRLEAKQKIGRTVSTFFIEGWIKAESIEILRQKISEITDRFELVEIPFFKVESPPVVLKNKKLIVPFEIITRMFGAPASSEVDPTPVLSAFFVLFFGICLGDAGYGIGLMLFTFWFLKKFRLPEGGRALLKLLFYGGLFSFLAGTLMGSWFGLNFEVVKLPLGLENLLLKAKVIDIFKSPLIMLYFSFFLGVVQIFTGLIMALINSLKNKNYEAAILDNLTWIVFLFCLVSYVVLKARLSSLAGVLGYFAGLAALVLVATQGRHKRTLLGKISSGILSLYKTSGFMGDMLSYSRLLALGMCSAVIAMVINIIAGMVKIGRASCRERV